NPVLRKIAAPPEEIAFRYAYIDVHRVQLINGGQKGCLRGDQPPFVELAAPYSAAYRRRDERIVQIEFRPDQVASRCLQSCFGCQCFRDCVIDTLAADSLFLEQRFHARFFLLCLNEAGLGLRDSCFSAEIGRFKGHRINQVKFVTRLDISPLGKKNFLDYSRHLGANLDGTKSLRSPDKLGLVGNSLRGDGNYLYLRGRLCWRGWRFLAAGKRGQDEGYAYSGDSGSR